MLTMRPKRKTGLAKKLQSMRHARGLTQVQAAEKIGVPLRTWISWENPCTGGTLNPSAAAMRLLRDTFPELA